MVSGNLVRHALWNFRSNAGSVAYYLEDRLEGRGKTEKNSYTREYNDFHTLYFSRKKNISVRYCLEFLSSARNLVQMFSIICAGSPSSRTRAIVGWPRRKYRAYMI